MAVTDRLRRTKYDNIASGSVAGPERTVAGDTVTVINMYGGGIMTSTSTGEAYHSNNPAGTSVSEGNLPDNMTVGVVPTDERIASSNTVGNVT